MRGAEAEEYILGMRTEGEQEKLALDVAQFEIVLKLWLWLVSRGIVMPHVSPNMPATERDEGQLKGQRRERGEGQPPQVESSKLSGHMHCVDEI